MAAPYFQRVMAPPHGASARPARSSTRAEDMLVILHSGNSSYVEELYRALGTVPP